MVRNYFLKEIKRLSLGMVLKWIDKINKKCDCRIRYNRNNKIKYFKLIAK